MKDIYLDMNSQNILKFYGTRLDARLDSSEFYDYEITKVTNDYNTDVLDLYTPIVYESLKIDEDLTNLQCEKYLINLSEDNISDLINGYTYSGLGMTLNYDDFTNHFGANYKNILLDTNRYKFILINGETHYFKIDSYNLARPDSNALTGYTKSQLISGFTTDVYKSRKNIIDANACSPLAPIMPVKPWAYDFSQGVGIDNCTSKLARRTEKGWTLDFIFNRNNLSWASGGIFYYWGVRGTNDVTDYADNNLSFGFTSDGRIKWSAYRYSGACVNGEYTESYYLSSGQTPTLCTTGATKDFNITITFDRYKHYDHCDIENDGGWNDMIGFRTAPYQNVDVTAVTSTQLTVWDPAESLSQKWADERQRRLGTLKIYVNGRPIYKLENWEEVIPSTRGTQPFIQSWGAGTGLMNNIHNGRCCFKMKSIRYYEEPLDFVHVRHDFLNRLEHYDFHICGLGCVDNLRGLSLPTPTPTPTRTLTPTPTPTQSSTPVPTHTGTPTPTPTQSSTPVPTATQAPTSTPTPTPTEDPINLNLQIEVSPGSIIVDFTVTSNRPIDREINVPVISYLNLLTSEILTVEATVTILSGQTSGTTRVAFAERSFSELDLSGNINVGRIILDGYQYEVFAELVFNTPAPTPTATNVITPTPNPTSTLTSTPTSTPTPTPTRTSTPIPTSTSTPTSTPTPTNTLTPVPTATSTPTPTSTISIPQNDFTYVIIPGNDLVYMIIPNNDLTYRLIPSNDLIATLLPNNDLEYLVLPLNDANYTLIPNDDLSYTLIPNNDLRYQPIYQLNGFKYILVGADPGEYGPPGVGHFILPNFESNIGMVDPNYLQDNDGVPQAFWINPIDGLGNDHYNFLYDFVINSRPYRLTMCQNDNCVVYTGQTLSYSGMFNSFFYDNTDGPITLITQSSGPFTNRGETYILFESLQDVAPTPTPTSTLILTATPTPTESSTPTPTPTASSTPTPTPTATSSPTPTASNTPTPTNTQTPTPTASSSPIPTSTQTPTPTATPILYLNCYTVRQYLYSYSGGGNSAIYVLASDYPNTSMIPSGATATINGTLVTATGVYQENSVYFNGNTGYRIGLNKSAGNIVAGTYIEFCWYSVTTPTPTPTSTQTPTPTPTTTLSSKSWSITQCGNPCDTGVCACNSQSTTNVYTLPSVTTLVVPGVTIYTDSSLTTTWSGYYYYPDSDEVWKFVNGVSSHQSSCAIGIDPCIP